jgi:hypothetical protein
VDSIGGKMDLDNGMANYLGFYDLRRDMIVINSDTPEMEQQIVVRHEYGHAFTHDMLLLRDGEANETLAEARATLELDLLQGLRQDSLDIEMALLPDYLRDSVEEYRSLPRDAYDGDGYFTSNYAEFLAESYGRLTIGDTVPTKTRELLLKFTS